MENIKDFLNYLKRTDTKVLSLDDFLNELKNTPERDLTGTLKTNILSHKDGLIPIDTFLENLCNYAVQGHFLSNSEIKNLEKDKTNYVYDDEWYTYNGDGNYLTHNINMNMFINDEGNYLVFLQVQVGLDKRSGFSSYVAINFDTTEDYENAFIFENTEYTLASCLIKTEEGNTLNISVTSNPIDYTANMYVTNNDTMENLFETGIYDADLDAIKDEVTNYISSDKELSKKYHIKEFTNYNGTPSVL